MFENIPSAGKTSRQREKMKLFEILEKNGLNVENLDYKPQLNNIFSHSKKLFTYLNAQP